MSKQIPFSMDDITHVVMDIEGTVVPIEFVHGKMFAYIRSTLETYLTTTWDSEQTQNDIELLITQSKQDVDNKIELPIKHITGTLATTSKDELITQVILNVTSQMDIDRKIGPLKTLQGHMWQQAFTTKEIVAELYDDVYTALQQWSIQTTDHIPKILSIYSSGSIGAQKLLFGHTQHGNITSLFTGGFFDTSIGFKRDKQSYSNILEQLQLTTTPEKCLFLTDIYEESIAARDAGMNTVLVVRPGNYDLPQEQIDNNTFATITSFLDLK